MDVQANSGQCCAKFFKTRHKDIADLIAGAVMQIGRGRLFRIGLQRLQPSQEGRDTNVPRDPDLVGATIASANYQATIRSRPSSGETPRLEGVFPGEIRPLIDESNTVLAYNAEVVGRARTHAGNLAYALKAPLSGLDSR